MASTGWRGGAFKCGPRDRWMGWRPAQQFERLDLVANNTRFLLMSEPGALPNLASFFLAAMTRRLAADWLAAHGHRVLVAETFCDPERFSGAMCRGSGWRDLGETRGYARSNGRHADPHGRPKRVLVPRLRRGAGRAGGRADCRRAQGRKHTVASVLAVHVPATLANMKGCLAAEQFARALSQEELAAVGGRDIERRDGLPHHLAERPGASLPDLLALNRGHRVRDTALGEDACLTRTGNGPLNRASLNTIALAVVFANRRDPQSDNTGRVSMPKSPEHIPQGKQSRLATLNVGKSCAVGRYQLRTNRPLTYHHRLDVSLGGKKCQASTPTSLLNQYIFRCARCRGLFKFTYSGLCHDCWNEEKREEEERENRERIERE